jgi:SAM-dependent methyltransferase
MTTSATSAPTIARAVPSVDEAVAQVWKTFPNEAYLHADRERAWRTVARYVEKYVKPGGGVMDFGSGPCDTAAVLAQRGFRVAAGDDLQDAWHLLPGMREKILGFAREWNVDFRVLEHDKPLPWGPQQFDMVMLHHVLEHLPDSPKGLMNAVLATLKDEGYLFVSVPSAVNIRKRLDILRGRTNYPPYEQYYWMPGTWRGHRREYCRDDLARMARYLGLTLVELTTYHFMLNRVPGPAQGVYKAVTSIFPDWRDSWILIAQRPKGWTPREEPPANASFLKSLHMTGERH